MSLPLWEQILGLIAGPAIDKDEDSGINGQLALKMLFVTVQQNNLERALIAKAGSWFGHIYLQDKKIGADDVDIIGCLVHAQFQQGSNFTDGFTKAWKLYTQTQCALVNQELDNYLRSKSSKDWFTIQYSPSEEDPS
ncbi:hypothetical protein L208DRAFT_1374412 [Tricholoma matsutake]|nr:hypothetical protein L208DRAFT_1374412 [Tricholoma matsutake 945]